MRVGDEDVLQLGHPGLRRVASPVEAPRDPRFREQVARLHRALAAFRERHGFGRAIAAPQIGVGLRFIALDLGDAAGPQTLVNPRVTWRSPERFRLWDDCLSFPSLLVRVERHEAITVEYLDLEGGARRWEIEDRAVSELLQHELDHLDGVLAVDRATGPNPLVYRDVFEDMSGHFASRVAS